MCGFLFASFIRSDFLIPQILYDDAFYHILVIVLAAKLISLSDSEAGGFYAEHEGKPFYNDLISFMTSGPVFIQVLEGEDAIAKNRELMGNTDPSKADAGTIRADFAQTIDANAVHGSDSEKSASREIAFFFSDL